MMKFKDTFSLSHKMSTLRMLWVATIILTFFYLSCKKHDMPFGKKAQNIANHRVSKVEDGNKFDDDDFSTDIITKAKKNLDSLGFKFPAKEQFRERILKVYGIDISKYDNNIIALRPADFPEIVIKNDQFILVQDSDSGNQFFINPEMLVYYNKFVFYKDKSAFNLLKSINPYLLKDLVIVYGFDEDKDLVKYVLKDYDFSNEVNTHDLIFSRRAENNKYEIRKGIMNDIEDFVYGGAVEDFSYAKEGNGYNSISKIIKKIEDQKGNYIDPDETIAYLYNQELQVGIVGDIQQKLDHSPDYAKFLRKNNFFKLEKLKEYVEVIYQSPDEGETDNKRFYIDDPDGFTNLRRSKTTASEIIQKIKSGAQIEVLDDSGDWFSIKTKEGKEGFVHKSKIKSE